jgi:N-acylglucosamine-6-phosphate 2-epimerase
MFMIKEIVEAFKNGCIVSCQALEDEPLFGSVYMSAMAAAAEMGGAVGIRANTPEDIAAIKKSCSLPVIGLYKYVYPGYDVYITPTMNEVRQVVHAGADLVAIDATQMSRPMGSTLSELVYSIRDEFPKTLIVADVSTFDEGVIAMDLGVDIVSTTMSGYTPYSVQNEIPDVTLIKQLSALKRTPVMAEGRIWTLDDCMQCINAGAHAVVIGTAITRPQEITKRFVNAIQNTVPKDGIEMKAGN